jgi:hypothetical protein
MNKLLCSILLIFISGYIFSQTTGYLPRIETEYKNEKKIGSLFYNINAKGEAATGNKIIFDENGALIVHQFDLDVVYFFTHNLIEVKSVLPLTPPINAGLTKAENGHLFFSIGDEVTYMKYNGEVVFKVNPYQIVRGKMFTSFCYVKNVLFFIDDRLQLYSLVNPTIDQAKNQIHYRNPEQTKKLFEPDSDIDLKGLSLDENSNLYIDGTKYYWYGVAQGKFKYQIVDTSNVSISDGTKKVRISTNTNENEIGESTAIHPSGDIYFLRYNKVSDKHLLYKIENTWDLDAKTTWEKREKPPK